MDPRETGRSALDSAMAIGPSARVRHAGVGPVMIDFGLASGEFRAAYFEQKPRHFRGALAERPFTWADVDQLLHFLEPRAPVMRIFHHGTVPEHAYTEEFAELGRTRRRLDKPKFYDYMRNGATLQINWLERHSVAAKRLCLAVGRFVGTQTSSNAYLSFAGDGTFGKHWDTHDVFAIQLIGRKRWRIFSPTLPLPLSHQTHDRSGHACPAEPTLELTLEEGDVLYIPRGWWHHVIPLRVGSFHVSVGSYSPTLFDYIVQTSARYLEQHAGVRRAFSPAAYRETVTEVTRLLSEVLLDPTNAAAFERDWIARERMDAEFNLASLDSASPPLSGGALLSLTTFSAPALEGGVLLVNGAQLHLEPVSQAVVAALRDHASLRFDALCARLEHIPPEAVHRAVLDLARHDVVTIRA
ncbi:MAG TPA: cupin domain-containing protein [Gammaproteobacteria bacterium]